MEVKKFLCWAGLLLLVPVAGAQVKRSVIGGGGSVIVGGEGSYIRPDSISRSILANYTSSPLVGPGIFFDVNLQPRWGAEGELRWLDWHGSWNEKQQDYLLGPRYRVYRWHNASAWLKFMMGAGREQFPEGIGHGSYFAYAPGIDIDDQLTNRIDVRIGYEYQFWPDAPNLGEGIPAYGMHPQGFTIGIGYRLINVK